MIFLSGQVTCSHSFRLKDKISIVMKKDSIKLKVKRAKNDFQQGEDTWELLVYFLLALLLISWLN